MSPLIPTPETQLRRVPERGSYDREFVYDVLDEGLVAHVAFVQDTRPFVIPMAYARLRDTLVLHGAHAARPMQSGREGLPLCVTVTLLDGLVLARSAFHHSMNYRSVMVMGTARMLTAEDEKRAALDALVDHVVRGRSREARPPNERELRATAVLALPIEQASGKRRSGGPLDDPEDLSWPCWSGDLPLTLATGPAQPTPEATTHQLPSALKPYTRR